jgi:protein-tyrosine phosphatase
MAAPCEAGADMSETARRTFEGLVNFRDLGGLPVSGGGEVRSGVLFRSDALCYATQADADHLVDKLSLATIIDLRDEVEVTEFGRGPLETMSVGYLSVPVGDVPEYDTRPEFYVGVLAQNGERLAALIRTLADPATLPAVVHCHVGCDRTGIVSAAVLSLVGVSDEDVAADYARSRRANDAIRDRSRERRRALGLPQMDDAYYQRWDPSAEVMAATLGLIHDRWGGMVGWATTAGLTSADLAALRTAIVG